MTVTDRDVTLDGLIRLSLTDACDFLRDAKHAETDDRQLAFAHESLIMSQTCALISIAASLQKLVR